MDAGRLGGLRLLLRWKPTPSGAEPFITTAYLTVVLDDMIVWPVRSAPVELEIQADDLLSHLTEFWKPLMLRQVYPLGLHADRPSRLRSLAEARWRDRPASVVEQEGERVDAFQEAHDLSLCFAGQFDLPSLWLMRQGESFTIESARHVVQLPFSTVQAALSAAGDEIAARLATSGEDRWSDLVQAWRARDKGDPTSLLAWSTGLDRDVARTLAAQGFLEAPDSVIAAAVEADEMRLAARMASALPAADVKKILILVQGLPRGDAPELDAMATAADRLVTERLADARPFEQGEAAARFVRDRLGLRLGERVEIADVVRTFGAQLFVKVVSPQTLSALAVWGNRHGPAVLLNAGGPAAGNRPIDRVNLAHELCHLLLDRGHALSAVEVLDNRMPVDVEQRAKAFAGELLLPGHAAWEAWNEAGRPRSMDGLKRVLRSLCDRYGVTQSVAAWKLDHGSHANAVDLRTKLDAAVPGR